MFSHVGSGCLPVFSVISDGHTVPFQNFSSSCWNSAIGSVDHRSLMSNCNAAYIQLLDVWSVQPEESSSFHGRARGALAQAQALKARPVQTRERDWDLVAFQFHACRTYIPPVYPSLAAYADNSYFTRRPSATYPDDVDTASYALKRLPVYFDFGPTHGGYIHPAVRVNVLRYFHAHACGVQTPLAAKELVLSTLRDGSYAHGTRYCTLRPTGLSTSRTCSRSAPRTTSRLRASHVILEEVEQRRERRQERRRLRGGGGGLRERRRRVLGAAAGAAARAAAAGYGSGGRRGGDGGSGGRSGGGGAADTAAGYGSDGGGGYGSGSGSGGGGGYGSRSGSGGGGGYGSSAAAECLPLHLDTPQCNFYVSQSISLYINCVLRQIEALTYPWDLSSLPLGPSPPQRLELELQRSRSLDLWPRCRIQEPEAVETNLPNCRSVVIMRLSRSSLRGVRVTSPGHRDDGGCDGEAASVNSMLVQSVPNVQGARLLPPSGAQQINIRRWYLELWRVFIRQPTKIITSRTTFVRQQKSKDCQCGF
ncbi:hypothetical protein GGX14DRAFT_543750 [Mycena pura]|uniref:Uncharacterized protein n=1 Tax=Mycena pura TaxID=153505 RepID=A0AAD6V9F2_9AGAR|nr:hypothetical protein GGX14DRAFT_543750 [Mycena pura]